MPALPGGNPLLIKENYEKQVTKAQETDQILIKRINFTLKAKDMHMTRETTT